MAHSSVRLFLTEDQRMYRYRGRKLSSSQGKNHFKRRRVDPKGPLTSLSMYLKRGELQTSDT